MHLLYCKHCNCIYREYAVKKIGYNYFRTKLEINTPDKLPTPSRNYDVNSKHLLPDGSAIVIEEISYGEDITDDKEVCPESNSQDSTCHAVTLYSVKVKSSGEDLIWLFNLFRTDHSLHGRTNSHIPLNTLTPEQLAKLNLLIEEA